MIASDFTVSTTVSPSRPARFITPARGLFAAMLVMMLVFLTGCPEPQVMDYSKPLPPGANALRKITDPAKLPDMTMAFNTRDANLVTAINNSLLWYNLPSTQKFFPSNDITHEQAQVSVFAFRELLAQSRSASEFQTKLRTEFDTYESVGCNWDDPKADKGLVFFTGYYTPIFTASKTKTDRFKYPLYRRPADLVSDPMSGEIKGRKVGDTVVKYPTRREIEANPAALGLAGNELVWLENKLDVYIIQVNGSTQLKLTDGGTLLVGYAGNNGYDYNSIGKLLVKDNKIEKNRVSLPTIRAYFQAHPNELDGYLNQNDRFVFLMEYKGDIWPAGSLGFKVTAKRSLATDKSIFPRGAVTMVKTEIPMSSAAGVQSKFEQLMLDQDTGGAIRAPGRGDIYMGIGPEAEGLAGHQAAEGQLYYFFLKPEHLKTWTDDMHKKMSAPAAKPMT
jgi:membrane-bound lytic murein transglycosylase A